jgi:D-serine deaminase-like pyridoxal phosphate-dependent protein
VIKGGGPDLIYDWFGDEYGRISHSGHGLLPDLGARLEIVVSHCDPTVNLFDRYHVIQNGRVVDEWPIDLRGCSQ